MGKIVEDIMIWLLARVVVSDALKNEGYYMSPQTTEYVARRIQRFLGGSSKVAVEVQYPHIFLFRADMPKAKRENILASMEDVLPTM